MSKKFYVHGLRTCWIAALATGWLLLAGHPSVAETYKLRVDGLACPFCSYGIEKQLGKLPGVTSLKTNIKSLIRTL